MGRIPAKPTQGRAAAASPVNVSAALSVDIAGLIEIGLHDASIPEGRSDIMQLGSWARIEALNLDSNKK